MSLMSPYELKIKLDMSDDRAKFVKEHSLPDAMKNVIVTDDISMHFFDDEGNDITKSVESIGEDAFYNCKSLTSIVIPDSVKSIIDYAFSHCKSLTSIVIPDSVENIGDSVFKFCKNLTSIIIPDSVENIGESAFYGCESLKSIVFKGKALEEVQSMADYPWGVDISIIKAEL